MALRDEQLNEAYQRLAEINRSINASLSYDEVFNLIVASAAHLVGAQSSFLLLNAPTQSVRIRAAFGVDEKLVHNFFGRNEEEVIGKLKRQLNLSESETLVSLPVRIRDSVSGFLVVVCSQALERFEEHQLLALADQAAIAVRNARFHEIEFGEANRERYETMEALRNANSRVTQILESITDLFYQLDREWRFTDVNRQTEIHFGKTRAELLGKVIWDEFPQAVSSIFYEAVHQAMDDMVAKHFEVASELVPGKWFEAHAYPSAAGVTVYLKDITERKQSELTRQLLSSIVESSEDAIISKSLDGVISSWNAAAERIFGYKASEAIGQSITLIIPEDRQYEEPAIIKRICSGRSVEHFETVRQRKDGKLIDISVTISPLWDEHGKLVGASKIARDITEHKRAQDHIRFQARLLDAVEQAVIATDLNGTVIFWNNFAERLYGWSSGEAIGANIFDLTPSPDSIERAAEIFAALQAGKSWSGEMQLRRSDDSVFPAQITDSPIMNEAGKLVGIVGVSVDITAEKRAEEERQKLLRREKAAREEAEVANRIKDEFLATLSHELRNPLNVVIGYAEILRRSEEAQKVEVVQKAVDSIRRNALAQSQLVSDLLDLSRLQMGKLAINRAPVSLTTIVADAIETVKAEADAKEIKLKLSTPDDPLIVDGDQVRLGQIIWNLLNNAVKFTPAGGNITISLIAESGCARLSVRDNGQGIKPDFLPYVFEIFRQADASSSRRQGGLGIGLALVKQLAELHGGHVKAWSAGLGKGACFTVTLPTEPSPLSALINTNRDAIRVLDKKSILVVDDSAETTEMLNSLLRMEGAYVSTARSGKEALRLASNNHFDVVISDISMPEMDGYRLLQELQKLPSMESVPVLALTGFGRFADIDRARDAGFAHHFTKPLDIEKLLETVKTLILQ